MDAQQQRLEVERAVPGDDHLAVDDAALRQRGPERVGELREVAVERLEVARLRVHLVAVAEDDGAEPVPLGLEQPAVALGQAVDRLGQHRFDRRGDGQVEGHRPSVGEGVSPGDRSKAALARSRPRFQANGVWYAGWASVALAPLEQVFDAERRRSPGNAGGPRRAPGWHRPAAPPR